MASSPKAPDPYKTASAQEKAEMAASQSSAIINNPNEYNTYGQVNYDIAGWEHAGPVLASLEKTCSQVNDAVSRRYFRQTTAVSWVRGAVVA